jgi:2-amino-4-hydroxy-6-hydroxymethyldihydropteridine diphosphokinase
LPSKFITAYIGVGANLGDARQQVKNALNALTHLPQSQLTASSSLYSSAPVDATGPDYVNAVACMQTTLSAEQLLSELRKLEQLAGRERNAFVMRNAPRTLDLDVLLYGDEVLHTNTLQVPHPRMHERAFVLLPLLEIAPELIIPKLGAAKQFLPQVAHQTLHKL